MLYENFTLKGNAISDEKIRCLLRVGQVVQKISSSPDMEIYDFMKVLDTYRDRYQGPQFV